MAKKTKKGYLTPEELKESAEKVWLAGLGALSSAQKEGDKMFRNLVDRGKAFEGRVKEEAGEAKEKAEDAWEDIEQNLKGFVDKAMKKVGIPVEEEMDKLSDQVDALSKRISRLASDLASEAYEAFESLRGKAEAATGKAKTKKKKKDKTKAKTTKKAAPKKKTTAKTSKKKGDKTIGKAKTSKSKATAKATMTHLGGGWYEIYQGGKLVDKVRGKANAEARVKALS